MVYSTQKNGDDWGMVNDIAIQTLLPKLFQGKKKQVQQWSLGHRHCSEPMDQALPRDISHSLG